MFVFLKYVLVLFLFFLVLILTLLFLLLWLFGASAFEEWWSTYLTTLAWGEHRVGVDGLLPPTSVEFISSAHTGKSSDSLAHICVSIRTRDKLEGLIIQPDRGTGVQNDLRPLRSGWRERRGANLTPAIPVPPLALPLLGYRKCPLALHSGLEESLM